MATPPRGASGVLRPARLFPGADDPRLAWRLFLSTLAFLLVIAPALSFATVSGGLANLPAQADAIAVVEILSTDYTATAADGPLYVESRVLKAVRGALRTGQRFRFGASAWVGPSFQQGQRRVVFLESLPARHAYYGKARWASLDAGKIDLSIAPEAVERCSVETLTDYIRSIEASRGALQAEYRLAKTSAEGLTLSIQIVNAGPQRLLMDTSAMHWSWEAAGVRRPLRVKWGRAGETELIAIAPRASVAASSVLPAGEVGAAREVTLSLANQAATFPAMTWVGMQSSRVALDQ